jgi:hypothetical protein
MARFDTAVERGIAARDAMRLAAEQMAHIPAAPGDGMLISTVRDGPIGVNRIDVALTQFIITGRALSLAEPGRIHEAVLHRRPAAAIAELQRLGGPGTAAIVVRPQPGRATSIHAAGLARLAEAAIRPPTANADRTHARHRPADLAAGARRTQ